MKKFINSLGKTFLLGTSFALGIIVVYAATTISGLGQKTIENGDKIGTGWFNDVDSKLNEVANWINNKGSTESYVDNSTSKYNYKTYKVIGNGNSNSWKCAKIIVPEQCMSENSNELGNMCKITHTQRHLPWDNNPGNSYTSNREKQGGWERHFRIFPRGNDSNHKTGKKRMMGGYTSSAGRWYTYTTTTTNENSRRTGLNEYGGILGRDKRKNYSQYSNNSAGGYDKDPREIMLITRNDFATTRTIKYPKSKSDSFFDKVFK